MFMKKASYCKVYTIGSSGSDEKGHNSDSYHDLLHEKENIRYAIKKTIIDYFIQHNDNICHIDPPSILTPVPVNPSLYSMSETVVRSVGLVVAGAVFVTGTVMLLGGSIKRGVLK